MNHLEYAFTFVQDDEEVDRAIAHALIAIAEQLEKMNEGNAYFLGQLVEVLDTQEDK